MLDDAVTLAKKALTANHDCWSLFNTNRQGIDPDKLLDSLELGSYYGSIGYDALDQEYSATTRPREIGVQITLNDDVNGAWAREGNVQRAGTLLHELGHAYSFWWGTDSSAIKPDNSVVDPDYIQGKLNTQAIDDNCLKGLQ